MRQMLVRHMACASRTGADPMTRVITAFVLAGALAGAVLIATGVPAAAGRYNVACIAPNGPWCRIACTSNRGVACYANVINGRCVKTCRYN
jgi:hypothetical protein